MIIFLIFSLFTPFLSGDDSAVKLNDMGNDTYQVMADFEIPATKEQVYSVITDFENMPKFIHGLKECKITKTDGNLVYVSQIKEVKYFIFHREVLMDLVIEKSYNTYSLRFEDTFHDQTIRYAGQWSMRDGENTGNTSVHYDVMFTLKSDVPHFIVKGVFHRESQRLLQSIWDEILSRKLNVNI